MRANLLPGAALVAALALTACGDDDGPAESPDSALVVRASDNLRWDQDLYEAEAGEIDIVVINDGNVAHTLLIEDAEGQDTGIKLSIGRRDEGSITLEAGEYVIWCDIPGHRAAGQESDLIVTE